MMMQEEYYSSNDNDDHHQEDDDEGNEVFLNFLHTAHSAEHPNIQQLQPQQVSSHASTTLRYYANHAQESKQRLQKKANESHDHHGRQSQRDDDDDGSQNDNEAGRAVSSSSSSASSLSSHHDDSLSARSFATKGIARQKPALHGRHSKLANKSLSSSNPHSQVRITNAKKVQPPSLPLARRNNKGTATTNKTTSTFVTAPPVSMNQTLPHPYRASLQQQQAMHAAAPARSHFFYHTHHHGRPPLPPPTVTYRGSQAGIRRGPEPLFFVSPAQMIRTSTMAAAAAMPPNHPHHHGNVPTTTSTTEEEEEDHAQTFPAPRAIPRQVSAPLEPPPWSKGPANVRGTPSKESTLNTAGNPTTNDSHNLTLHDDGSQLPYSHHQIATWNANITTATSDVAASATTATPTATMNHTPLTNAVYFGWIRHSATQTWRNVVKRFSHNRQDYPSWSDDVYQHIRNVMRDEEGIDTYFICQKPSDTTTTSNSATTNPHSSTNKASNPHPERKKIFDKNKQYLGTWRPATPQEVLDRTKQRFIDDRKPAPVVVGVKRPRGRPPKVAVAAASREVSLNGATTITTTDATLAMTTICNTLHQLLVKCQAHLKRVTTTSNPTTSISVKTLPGDDRAGELANEGMESQQRQQHHVDAAQLLTVMQSLEQTQLLIRRRLEITLEPSSLSSSPESGDDAAVDVTPEAALDERANDSENAKVVTDDSSSNSSVVNEQEEYETSDSSLDPPPSKKGKMADNSSGTILPKRKPWFPVLSHHVCLGWNHHPGTAKWQNVIKTFADDKETYSEWDDKLTELVKEKLGKEEGCTNFLVFLDHQGQPCTSINDGVWFLATDEVLLESTKEQFLDVRRMQDRETVH